MVSALYCYEHGISCEMHESRSRTGGILQDWIVDGDWFFHNCQYLNPCASWFNLLPKSDLVSFPLEYGSFTDLWGEACAVEGYAGPVYTRKESISELKRHSQVSLRDRLNAYPDPIFQPMLEWVTGIGINPENVHASAAIGLQISRILPLHFFEETLRLKRIDHLADELYGLPRDYRGANIPLSALPQSGYDSYFKLIEDKLADRQIKLKLSTKDPGNLLKQSLNNPDSASESVASLAWTGSPVPLIRSSYGHSLRSPVFKMRNIVAKWHGYHFQKPFYIQVFSRQCPITRIFVYSCKATIECTASTLDDLSILSSSLDILRTFGHAVPRPEVYHSFSDDRHFLCTPHDYQFLEKVVSDLKSPRLIVSPWHVYERDLKIKHVLQSIESHFLV